MKHMKFLTVLCLLLMVTMLFVACDHGGNDDKEPEGDTNTPGTEACSHEYTDVVTAPTCTAQGYTTHTCSKCGDTKKDTYVDAAGHDYTDTVTAPTCTKDGYTTHKCKNCTDSFKDSIVDLLGHDWDAATATNTTCKCLECQTSWVGSNATFVFDDIYVSGKGTIGYKITGFEGSLPSNLSIPAFHEGKPVMAIGQSAFSDTEELTGIRIPDTVTSIESNAFGSCGNLATVTLPDTLTHIGRNPFVNTRYEYNETKETTGHFTNTVHPFIINDIYLITPLIEFRATEYTVPEGIKLIADEAFNSYTNAISLETITLPKSLRYLGSGAFIGSSHLKVFYVYKGVVAFGDCPLGGGNHLEFDEVRFEGTQAEWQAIDNVDNFSYPSRVKYNQKMPA